MTLTLEYVSGKSLGKENKKKQEKRNEECYGFQLTSMIISPSILH
jgi:hypothetical protein